MNRVKSPPRPPLRRYYMDAEFLEIHGEPSTFSVINLAIASDDLAEPIFYAISADFDSNLVPEGHFVGRKILPLLEPEEEVPRLKKSQIRDKIMRYLKPAVRIEMWHYKAWGDRTALRHIFQGEVQPHFNAWDLGELFFHDMDQKQLQICALELPEHHHDDAHHPVEDVQWLRECVHHLDDLEARRKNFVFDSTASFEPLPPPPLP